MAEEQKLQTKILNDLRSFGKYCECFKIEKVSENGIPDVFFTMRICGPVFVEVKRTGEEPSNAQWGKIQKLNDCGTKAMWVNSWKGWVDLKLLLGINNREAVISAHNWK